MKCPPVKNPPPPWLKLIKRHGLSVRMAFVLLLQANGHRGNLQSISIDFDNSREALRRRKLLIGYTPSRKGWRVAAELSREHGSDELTEYCLKMAKERIQDV